MLGNNRPRPRANPSAARPSRLVADALALPFPDNSFDLVSCSLFAHHLEPAELERFTEEAWRVSRCAVLINDLVRHPCTWRWCMRVFPS